MTRVAVIGPGDVSVVHLAAIEKLGADLVGVCDSDHRRFLDDLRPEVVHICTPHDQHVPIAIDALERGAHVFLEKPVAHTLDEAERLIAAAKEFPHLKVGVCLQNRYNLASRHARDLLPGLGEIAGASATVLWHRTPQYYRNRPWRGDRRRSGGGVLINQAIHTIDLVQWLVGDVTAVRGHAGRYGGFPGDVEDTASLMLDHANGARSVIFATVTNATDSPVSIEIVTEKATLTLRGDLTVAYADGRVDVVAEHRESTGGRDYWGASHELIIADFYRKLADPEPFWIGPEEAIRSQQLIDALYRQNT
ncbi:Gfo/Idh/MocA family protein [Actinoplanes sp. NPDC051513]|uniref:Gfo/Idh/MocA family protein n=1 Tax=Actinoplanes sp. NPDC051513 TaxID=3363908 RepID=UPI0037B8E8AC